MMIVNALLLMSTTKENKTNKINKKDTIITKNQEAVIIKEEKNQSKMTMPCTDMDMTNQGDRKPAGFKKV